MTAAERRETLLRAGIRKTLVHEWVRRDARFSEPNDDGRVLECAKCGSRIPGSQTYPCPGPREEAKP